MYECAEVKKRTVGRGDDARTIVEYIPNYRLSDFLRLRSDPDAYSDYFKYFLPAVGRKSFWRHLVSNAKCDSDLATVSNEAFGLLVLENHWERWLDMYQKSRGKVDLFRTKRRTKEKREKAHCISNIPPKYTKGGIVYKNRRKSHEDGGKGWSAKGIERFNELFDLVKLDRKEYPGFLQEWIAKEKRSWKRKERLSLQGVDDFPVARHELGPLLESDDLSSPSKKRRMMKEEDNESSNITEHLLSLRDDMPSEGEDMATKV